MTDTNQASEDELSVEIDGYIDDIRYNNEVPFDERLESAKKSIKHLVRTEKLNLLAEVREEAFSGGLSFELDDGRIVIEVETDLKSITTKLETEL